MTTYNQTLQLAEMHAMLGRLNARCMWIMPGPEDTSIKQIHCYLIGQRLVMPQIFEEGWDYFIGGAYRSLSDIEYDLEQLRK